MLCIIEGINLKSSDLEVMRYVMIIPCMKEFKL